MQVRIDALQRQLPAGTGDGAAVCGQAQAGVQIELAGAQFHAAAAVAALADQQRLAALAGVLKQPRRTRLQPLVVAQLAAQMVGRTQAAAVEIQPQFASQVDLVALAALVAACAGSDAQARIVVQGERGQIAPVAGHAGLRSVDGLPFGAAAAQRRIVAIAPGFLARPGRGGQLERHLFQRRGGARMQGQHPMPRAQLHAQAAVVFQPRRQVAVERGGNEACRQDRPEQDLARAAGHVELQLRLQRGGQAVAELAVDAQRQGIGGALRGGGFAQRKFVAVAFHVRHRRAVQAQRDQADLRRHAQARRPFRPRQRAAQLIVAGRQPQHRPIVVLQHHGRLVVRRHRLRPRTLVARQCHPARRVHVHIEAETRAVLAGIQRKPAGPCALAAVGAGRVAGGERAGMLRHVVQHPALPVAQGRRYVLRRQGRGQQQPEGQQSCQSSKHAFLSMCHASVKCKGLCDTSARCVPLCRVATRRPGSGFCRSEGGGDSQGISDFARHPGEGWNDGQASRLIGPSLAAVATGSFRNRQHAFVGAEAAAADGKDRQAARRDDRPQQALQEAAEEAAA